MGHYDKPDAVEDYARLTAGTTEPMLIDTMIAHLTPGDSVLEIGMGPGHDLDLLSEYFQVTGSDLSTTFLDRYRRLHPGADVLQLDARTLETEQSFAAIYSNKVLQHLDDKGLRQSLARQLEILAEDGIVLHSFWHGEGEETQEGLLCRYHTEASLTDALPPGFDVVDFIYYKEFEPRDSFAVVLKKL